MKVVKKIKVKNAMGLHIRPATAIVKLLQNFQSSITFTHKKMSINARSIMSILMLVAKKNATITITIEGDDAEIAMVKLCKIFDTQFGE